MDDERWNGEMDELDDASAGITLCDHLDGYTTWEGVGPLDVLLGAATAPEYDPDRSRELDVRSAFRAAVSFEPDFRFRCAARNRALRRRWIALSSAAALAVSGVFVSSVPLAEAYRLPVVGSVISSVTGHRNEPPRTLQIQQSPFSGKSAPVTRPPAPAACPVSCTDSEAPESSPAPPVGNPGTGSHGAADSTSGSSTVPADATHRKGPASGKGHGHSKGSHPGSGNPPGPGNPQPGQGGGPPPPHHHHHHHHHLPPTPTGAQPGPNVSTEAPSRPSKGSVAKGPGAKPTPTTGKPANQIAIPAPPAIPAVLQSPTPVSPVTGTPAPSTGAAGS